MEIAMTTSKLPMIKFNYTLIIYLVISMFTGFILEASLILLILFLHELGHIITIYLFNGKVNKLTISLVGGLMDVSLNNNRFLPNLLVHLARCNCKFFHLYYI